MDTNDAGRALRDAVALDLRRAQKDRDRTLMEIYRSLLSAIDNAEAVEVPVADDQPRTGLGSTEVPRRRLSSADVQRIVTAEIDERTHGAATYRELGAEDAAAALDAAAQVLRSYLPSPPAP